ncbi:glycosyltransferase [Streptomyces phyllanthi]|uniref:glycosyltransferase n=1 Tax=Streptomyces phyllanthi TaxID=1803180 RepID=UPI00128C711A|nr:glycosyltransferase [Streptomyces phyllanthi]
MRPQLSVIVPFHNVERYFAECLESIAGQTFDDFEVVLVDDGSTDVSCEIASDFVQKDSRFRLICQRQAGVGAARNAGIRQARGHYLSFADADDIVAGTAYEYLIGSLRRSGSEMACGGVQRFNSERTWPSSLHHGIFDEEAIGTHITRAPELLGDRTVWNKVYRRSFWDRHGFRFPHHLMEDAPVAVPAHVLARGVDVLPSVVYFWRVRDDGPQSITQRLFEPTVLAGRMMQVRTVADFLAEYSLDLKKAYDVVALEHDVFILLVALPHIDETRRSEILRFTESFLKDSAEGAVHKIGAENRRFYRLLAERRIPELIRLAKLKPYSTYL